MTWLTSCYSNKLMVWTDTIAVTKLYVRFRACFCVFGKFNPSTANMPSSEAKSSHWPFASISKPCCILTRFLYQHWHTERELDFGAELGAPVSRNGIWHLRSTIVPGVCTSKCTIIFDNVQMPNESEESDRFHRIFATNTRSICSLTGVLHW